jgi:hypothetical protein
MSRDFRGRKAIRHSKTSNYRFNMQPQLCAPPAALIL